MLFKKKGFDDELTAAILARDIADIDRLLRSNQLIFDGPDSSGEKALYYAIRFGGNLQIVQMLLAASQYAQKSVFWGGEALCKAAYDGKTEIVHNLLHAGISTYGESDGSTALEYAAGCGHIETMHMLVAYGANVNFMTPQGGMALGCAALNGQLESTSFLLSAGAIVDAVDPEGMTAMQKAALRGRTPVLDLLIQAGANVNHHSDGNVSPLLSAAFNGHAECAEHLINAGADVNDANQAGMTPLHFSAMKGHAQVVELLVKAGAHIDAREEEYCTPLHLATRDGHLAIVEILVKGGSDLNATEIADNTPLLWAIRNGWDDIALYLLNAGADTDIANNLQQTALGLALEGGRTDVTLWLMKADPRAGGTPGQTSYTNSEWGLSFQYPSNWRVLMENDVSGTWEIPITVGGEMRHGQCPAFMVNARRDEMLSPPHVISTQNIGGLLVESPHSPQDHNEQSKLNLPMYFSDISFLAAGEARLTGGIPAASLLYTYDSDGGPVRELSITAFCRQCSFQLICDMPDDEHETYMPVFIDILNSLVINREPIDIHWPESDEVVHYEASEQIPPKVKAPGAALDISSLTAKLVSECQWHFSNVDNYEALQGEFQRREDEVIRPIGEQLNAKGGLALMRYVYEEVEAACGRSCRSALEMKWNHIGDWRS